MNATVTLTPRVTGPHPPAAPRDGDVVVTHTPHVATAYTICQLPARAQICTAVRGEAIRIAREFAEEASVNLWYRDGDTCRLMESYRR